MNRRILQKATEFIRREGRLALPAAIRAARHGVKEAAKKFPEEYAREREKR